MDNAGGRPRQTPRRRDAVRSSATVALGPAVSVKDHPAAESGWG